MTRIVTSIPLLYLLLLIPAARPVWHLFAQDWYYPDLMFQTGVWSIYLLILTISVSPALAVIRLIGHGKALGRWLLPRRRHFGLVSAIYAFVHVAHYLLYTSDVEIIWIELFQLAFLTGWGSLLIFAVLAATSNGPSARYLGSTWKTLHLLIYPAAALAFWHWSLFDFHPTRWIFWAGVFCVPKLIQFAATRSRKLLA